MNALATLTAQPGKTTPQLIAELRDLRRQFDKLNYARFSRCHDGPEEQLLEQMRELDARIWVHSAAIRAALDLLLEPAGLTVDGLMDLNL